MNPNPSFPFPEKGNISRSDDEGCLSCVHKSYCQAWYWFRINNHTKNYIGMGTSCLSWSNNDSERITEITQGDIDENIRFEIEGLAKDPNQNDETLPISSNSRNRGKIF